MGFGRHLWHALCCLLALLLVACGDGALGTETSKPTEFVQPTIPPTVVAASINSDEGSYQSVYGWGATWDPDEWQEVEGFEKGITFTGYTVYRLNIASSPFDPLDLTVKKRLEKCYGTSLVNLPQGQYDLVNGRAWNSWHEGGVTSPVSFHYKECRLLGNHMVLIEAESRDEYVDWETHIDKVHLTDPIAD